jgi:hypothetical protein
MLKSYGIRDKELSLCILVVSSDIFCEKLSDALYTSAKKQGMYKPIIYVCKRVQDVLNATSNPHVDFIVFGIDTRSRGCLKEVEEDITVLSTAFTLGRVCFVHDNDIKPLEMAVNYNDVFDLQRKYGGHMLAGCVANEPKCLYLAQRILKLLVAVTGVYSGIPYIGCAGKNTEQ